jgi:uncharacterized protein YmfQ (DUF2313 family)
MPFVDIYGDDYIATLDDGIIDIVTEDYCEVLPKFLPKGRAWKIRPDGMMAKLFCALGYEFSRIERRGRDVLDEADPRTTQELLEDWERVLALPGHCQNPPTTVEGRQAAIHAKLTQLPPSSEADFLALAETLGYPDAEIRQEHDPFICGTSVCGDALKGHHGHWTYTWTLITNASGDNDSQLMCLMREAEKIHAIIIFEFPGEDPIVRVP